MTELLEYFYCLVYVSSLTFCVYKYLDRKPSPKELIVFLLFYGFIDYLITGKIKLDIKYNLIITILTLLSDYICLCILNRKFKIQFLFYTSLYLTIYSKIVIIITYLLNYINEFNIFIILSPSLFRFIIVIIFNGITGMIYKFLKNKSMLFEVDVFTNNHTTLCVINILICFVESIFHWLNKMEQGNIYLQFISIVVTILWLILLYAFNKSIIVKRNNENQMITNFVSSEIEQYIDQYRNEEEKIQKVRHDIKNHFMIIKNLSDEKNVKDYIDKLYPSLNNIKTNFIKITDNIYVDAIINSKITEYPNVNISYHCNLSGLKMNSRDLSVIVFNLIDNACQAAGEIRGNVDITMIYNECHLFIEVKNSCRGTPDFHSKKGIGHGYGMRIIDDIVKKYKGCIEYGMLEDEVIIKVGLILQE